MQRDKKYTQMNHEELPQKETSHLTGGAYFQKPQPLYLHLQKETENRACLPVMLQYVEKISEITWDSSLHLNIILFFFACFFLFIFYGVMKYCVVGCKVDVPRREKG